MRVELQSGAMSVIASESTFPNGLALDSEGNIFITNIFAGTVARVTTAGKVSVFADGPLLAAKPTAIGFTIGPNDITFDRAGTALYVTNVGQNTVGKIEVRGDGAAGSITNFAVGISHPGWLDI